MRDLVRRQLKEIQDLADKVDEQAGIGRVELALGQAEVLESLAKSVVKALKHLVK